MIILNRKKIKEILRLIKDQWDCSPELDYAFLLSPKNKIFLVTKDIAHVDLSEIKVNNIGNYFGELKNGELRLSIEGSQLIGPYAQKNVVDIDDDQAKLWLKGKELAVEQQGRSFVLIKHGDDFMGCGKLLDNRILNYVPKARRVDLFHSDQVVENK